MSEQAMRLAAGYLSATMLLLLIGYVIGYAVCLWRYVDTGDTSYEQSPSSDNLHVNDA